MGFESWRDFYASDLQGVYAVVVVPALFLVYLILAEPRRASPLGAEAARFVRGYALVFGVETLLDALAGGLLPRWLGGASDAASTAIMVAFVLIGDFRVFLLVLFLANYGRATAGMRTSGTRLARVALEAAGWTLVVPAVALTADTSLRALGVHLPERAIWPIYEGMFVVMAIVLQRVALTRVPREFALRAYIRAITAYVAVYYALWATADILIQLSGLDVGWALRVIPNQLYYAFYVPLAYVLFFSIDRPAAGWPELDAWSRAAGSRT